MPIYLWYSLSTYQSHSCFYKQQRSCQFTWDTHWPPTSHNRFKQNRKEKKHIRNDYPIGQITTWSYIQIHRNSRKQTKTQSNRKKTQTHLRNQTVKQNRRKPKSEKTKNWWNQALQGSCEEELETWSRCNHQEPKGHLLS